MSDSPIPTDQFSLRRRKLTDDPGALVSGSTIHTTDFYGNGETWNVETYRTEDRRYIGFLQRNSPEGGLRLVLPEQVMVALGRHLEQLQAQAKRRQGHNLVALRKQRGDKLGNPDALRAARAKRKKAGK